MITLQIRSKSGGYTYFDEHKIWYLRFQTKMIKKPSYCTFDCCLHIILKNKVATAETNCWLPDLTDIINQSINQKHLYSASICNSVTLKGACVQWHTLYALSKRWVLSLFLKMLRLEAWRMSNGREFQSFGAAWENARPPYDDRLNFVVYNRLLFAERRVRPGEYVWMRSQM